MSRYSRRRRKNIFRSWLWSIFTRAIHSKRFWQGLAIFLWLVYMAYQMSQLSQGSGNIILLLAGVIIPVGYVAYKYERRSKRIRVHSYAFVRTMEIIENFKPSFQYPYEEPYQMELFRELQSQLPSITVELEKAFGSSRADIAVDKIIGIEVKGPTTTKDLQTIADKCLRYSEHFDYVIVVLFGVRILPRMYDEWSRNIRKHYPNIPIIRIDKVRDRPSQYFKEWSRLQSVKQTGSQTTSNPWVSRR